MNTEPNSPFDKLSQDFANIRTLQQNIMQRLNRQDETILKILKTIQTGEQAFELRVTRVLSNAFKGLTEDLDHAIEHHADAMARLQRGYDLFVVDGIEVKENDKTVIVTKTEAGYDFALASDPETIINDQTEQFHNFFDSQPGIFEHSNSVLVNIISYVTEQPAEQVAEVVDHVEA